MGFIPTVPVALAMSVITMLCWGSWSVTLRRCGDWRFEAWYIDYSWSIIVGTAVVGLMLGSVTKSGWNPSVYMASLSSPPLTAISWAIFAGIVWGAGNLLLAAAIRLAGLALAFPVGIGLALTLGTVLAYGTNPGATRHPLFLFGGLALVVSAICANGLAHAAKHARSPTPNLKLGLRLSAICGLLIALFPFPFNFAFKSGLSGEAGALYMALGALLASAILVPYFMRHPLVPGDKAIDWREYARAPTRWHLWAITGGAIWSVGMVFNLVVANQPRFSVAIAYTLGQCAAMVAALWGILVWKEFRGAPVEAYWYLAGMFGLFLAGIVLLANATG